MERDAVLSADRQYRYSLTRTWGNPENTLIVIGLNPSTADEYTDDPTIRRCLGFAQRFEMGRLVMLNLFAFRATAPRELFAASSPIGADNDATLQHWCGQYPETILAAWGAHGGYKQRDRAVCRLLHEHVFLCLGQTKKRQPKHPLYLAANTPLEVYKP